MKSDQIIYIVFLVIYLIWQLAFRKKNQSKQTHRQPPWQKKTPHHETTSTNTTSQKPVTPPAKSLEEMIGDMLDQKTPQTTEIPAPPYVSAEPEKPEILDRYIPDKDYIEKSIVDEYNDQIEEGQHSLTSSSFEEDEQSVYATSIKDVFTEDESLQEEMDKFNLEKAIIYQAVLERPYH